MKKTYVLSKSHKTHEQVKASWNKCKGSSNKCLLIHHRCGSLMPLYINVDHHTCSLPNTVSQLYVFGHNCHPLGMYSTQVCIFEQTYQIGLSGFLQSSYCLCLKSEVGLEILSNLLTNLLKGSFLMSNSNDFWYLLIS